MYPFLEFVEIHRVKIMYFVCVCILHCKMCRNIGTTIATFGHLGDDIKCWNHLKPRVSQRPVSVLIFFKLNVKGCWFVWEVFWLSTVIPCPYMIYRSCAPLAGTCDANYELQNLDTRKRRKKTHVKCMASAKKKKAPMDTKSYIRRLWPLSYPWYFIAKPIIQPALSHKKGKKYFHAPISEKQADGRNISFPITAPVGLGYDCIDTWLSSSLECR